MLAMFHLCRILRFYVLSMIVDIGIKLKWFFFGRNIKQPDIDQREECKNDVARRVRECGADPAHAVVDNERQCADRGDGKSYPNQALHNRFWNISTRT